jgi:integrase
MCAPEMLGAYDVNVLSKELVKTFFAAIADRPGKQETCLKVLRLLEAWAIDQGFLQTPITTGIEIVKIEAGHMPWTEEHVALALAHLPPMLARVVTLMLHTGQRGSDIVKLGPRSIRRLDGIEGFEVVQQKTGHKTKITLFIPIVPELKAAMSTWEDSATFIHDADGKPYTRGAISQQFRRARDKIDALSPLRAEPDPIALDDRKEYLRVNDHFSIGEDGGLVLHGLRGTVCVRLRRRGASEGEISKWIGMSIPMVTRYTRGSDQAADTIAAARRLGFFPVEHAQNVVPLRTGT